MPAATARNPGLLMEPMLPDDLDAVLAIELKSFSTPWTDTMFLSEMRQGPGSQLLVARLEKRPTTVAGYIGYRAVLDEMHIMIIAVASGMAPPGHCPAHAVAGHGAGAAGRLRARHPGGAGIQRRCPAALLSPGLRPGRRTPPGTIRAPARTPSSCGATRCDPQLMKNHVRV